VNLRDGPKRGTCSHRGLHGESRRVQEQYCTSHQGEEQQLAALQQSPLPVPDEIEDEIGRVLSIRGETTYKRWNAEPPYLAPYSSNKDRGPIFFRRRRDLEIVGRVRRTVLDL
jgi:hypothetical protein